MKSALVIGIVVVIAAGVIVMYLYRRKEAFSGTVVDKDIQEQVQNINNQSGVRIGGMSVGNNVSGNVTHSYIVKIQLPSGKTKSWQVSEGQYQEINIGDQVNKSSGTTSLTVTSKSATPSAPSQNNQVPPIS